MEACAAHGGIRGLSVPTGQACVMVQPLASYFIVAEYCIIAMLWLPITLQQ